MTTFNLGLAPQWLKPYTDITLKALPAKGIKKLILCPGSHRLHWTLEEEIEIEAKICF